MGKESLRVVSKQDLAKEIKVGMRMPSFKVLNQADARPWHFQELLKSKGCWRLVVFAGNVKDSQQKARIEKLGKELGGEKSFLKRFTPGNKRYDGVIEVLTVHSAPRQETTIFDFPAVFRPWDETDGWDYWKIFVDDQSYHEGHGHAYQNYGVDPEKGCAVVLRPDQYVSLVTEVDDYEGLDHFFSGFMVEQKQPNGSIGKGPEANGNGAIVEGGSGSNGLKAGDEAAKGTGGS
jgi:phenol 2-monooxygenase